MNEREIVNAVRIGVNKRGIAPGVYLRPALAELIREKIGDPEALAFIADAIDGKESNEGE